MKGVLLIIDGLGDLPVPALGHITPLEAARTPFMDRLAALGRYGLVDPIGAGELPNTHSGGGLLLGMRPGQADRLHRGPVEAAGKNVQIAPGDIALRANFATLSRHAGGFKVLDRRAGRIDEHTGMLAANLEDVHLGDGVRASLQPTDQHRGVLVLSGPDLHDAVTDTDPGDMPMPADLLDCEPLKPAAELAAQKINAFIRIAYEQLNEHPVNRGRLAEGLPVANGVITRGAGSVLELDNVVRDKNLSAALVSGCNTVKGLGRLFGFEVVNDERFTGAVNTDLDGKVAALIAQLELHDVVFVHIKAPDVCSHDRDPSAKRDFLERLDHALGPLLERGVAVAISADHTTDSNTGFHTSDPVPAILYSPEMEAGGRRVKFGETACRNGNLPRMTGHEFLLEFIRYIQ
jgi:2,3-bisphosphoglycerate-independent phosphoglycerate mutase